MKAPDGLLAVLDGAAPPALLPWQPAALPPADVEEAARRAGWRTALLDLTGVTGKDAFMDRCAHDLWLPEYFGRNWDALADCFTDLSWPPYGNGGGRLLLVRGWQAYAAADPHGWGIARGILADAVEYWQDKADTPLAVLLEEATSGDTSGQDLRP
ncbi:barstar family protein [Actinacidiphila oryziradicis]|jgi:hypothetical protein|uniref:barstar family protein n=1 Tax=Actinacidiphila oryziradicis TaxID=2571141 RepID=UPI0023F37E3B|nr:barstar family protein [Actinacidiphila oryziradicis]MCW2873749.1 hypothetical protein [Actinacidiphila oryziradicis]